MATNPYFRQAVRSEQNMYEDIVIEALRAYGQDIYYLPRDIINEDTILNEDIQSRFNSSHKIEMYIENTEGFDGEGDLFTKFGVEIRDQATFVVSKRRWEQTVARFDNEINSTRPYEGDLIYLPLTNKVFEIMHVEHEQPFYQLSNLPTFKLRVELFEYSNEIFDTGVETIDDIARDYAFKYILQLATPRVATVLADITAQQLTSLTISDSGQGYIANPDLTVSLPTLDSATALINSFLDGEIVNSLVIDSGGRYYSETPSITIAAPTNIDSDQAQAISSLNDNNKIESITVIDGGRGYISVDSNVPTVSLQEPNRALYNATASVLRDSATNKISGITLLETGFGYDSAPAILVSDPDSAGGVTATAIATLDANTKILSISIVDSGSGYTTDSNLSVTIDQSPAFALTTMPTFSATVDNGAITDISIVDSGNTIFEFIPSVTVGFPNGGLSDFRATATVSSVQSGIVDGVTLTYGGNYYDTEPTVTVEAPTGTKAEYRATATATYDSDTSKVNSVLITSAGQYYDSAPTVTVESPGSSTLAFEKGEIVLQTLTDGSIIRGTVAAFSDSDYKLHLIDVGATDGHFHEYIPGRVVKGQSSGIILNVESVVKSEQAINNTQNDNFSDAVDDFLDFTETNPFGDPENN